MESGEATELLGDLASQQWGLFTSAQARDLDIKTSDLLRLEKAGVLERVRHGVYAITGTALSAMVELKAQWLAIRPDMMAADRLGDESLAKEAVVSHSTAADLWGIGDLWPDGYHFTVQKRRRSRQPEVHFHRADLEDGAWEIHKEAGLPITTVARTIADLADAGHEAEHLMSLVSDAGNKNLVSHTELFEALYGKETALGLNMGEEDGLRALLADRLGTYDFDPRIAQAIDLRLQPIRESFSGIAQAIWSDTTMSNELKLAMKQATEAINQSFSTGINADQILRHALQNNPKGSRGK